MKYVLTESQYKKLVLEQGYLSHELSTEERKEEIIRRKNQIENLLPKIIKYFKIKYKNELEKIDIEYKSSHFGNERLSLEYPRIDFYFLTPEIGRFKEIKDDLKDVFDIDISMYGVPLSVRILELTWKIVHG